MKYIKLYEEFNEKEIFHNYNLNNSGKTGIWGYALNHQNIDTSMFYNEFSFDETDNIYIIPVEETADGMEEVSYNLYNKIKTIDNDKLCDKIYNDFDINYDRGVEKNVFTCVDYITNIWLKKNGYDGIIYNLHKMDENNDFNVTDEITKIAVDLRHFSLERLEFNFQEWLNL